MLYFVLEHEKKVINGPRLWNQYSFQSTLSDELGIDFVLPTFKNDSDIITISDNIHIYPAELRHKSCDVNFEYLHGPLWDYTNDIAIGTFEVLQHDLPIIKRNLKGVVASQRYLKEITGTSLIIQDETLFIETNRDAKSVFFQKYITQIDGEVIKWKFNNTWLDLTKNDMLDILTAINSHIQLQYDWEAEQSTIIESCTSLDSLKSLKLGFYNEL